MPETYLIVAGGVLLGQIAPGPNLLAVAGVALSLGRLPALALAFGGSLEWDPGNAQDALERFAVREP